MRWNVASCERCNGYGKKKRLELNQRESSRKLRSTVVEGEHLALESHAICSISIHCLLVIGTVCILIWINTRWWVYSTICYCFVECLCVVGDWLSAGKWDWRSHRRELVIHCWKKNPGTYQITRKTLQMIFSQSSDNHVHQQ